jgi:hypothetical protein
LYGKNFLKVNRGKLNHKPAVFFYKNQLPENNQVLTACGKNDFVGKEEKDSSLRNAMPR